MTDVRFRHSAGVAPAAARHPTFAPESAPERPRSVLSSSTGLFGRGGMQAAHGGAGMQPRSALPGMAQHGHASRGFHPGAALHGPAHGFGHAAHLQPPAHMPPPMHFQAFQPPAYAAPHYGMGHGGHAAYPTAGHALPAFQQFNPHHLAQQSSAFHYQAPAHGAGASGGRSLNSFIYGASMLQSTLMSPMAALDYFSHRLNPFSAFSTFVSFPHFF
ncbi:hypothetical protein M5C97_08215 [Acidovorax sp. NCPPB 3859]|nr:MULTISPECIES: hypothetical protein [unclassified Acidovorax]MDA8452167.1 hypothetical protein [Acidovorax sp. GBBC 3297]MDA8461613.1 hypothetical protein [Acidovorax sp. GBBC 3333]MDA8466611.1 hypothetical protein [Acidovorax sp. GBBC 3332]MDA8471682.1 hypothetical protein [Acidovorax sp. GBBC 3299]WCM80256.1 hypothetical protein M5C94_08210 [Acidovorax sp. GBBC 712]